MLALLVFLLTLVICILGHFLPLVLLFYTSTNEAWVERITIATPYFLDSLWDYSVELVLDYTSFEALRKDAAPTSATDVEATIDPREAKVDLTEAATDLTEVTTKPKEAAIGPMQRTIRKSDAPNAFLKGFLLKVPSIIAMSATNLQTQMCFLYALLISVLVAVVLGLGFYLIFSPQAKSTQHAKAARDDATEAGEPDVGTKQDAFTATRAYTTLLRFVWGELQVLLLWLSYPYIDHKLSITFGRELYGFQSTCDKMMQNFHRACKIWRAMRKRGFWCTAGTGAKDAWAAQRHSSDEARPTSPATDTPAEIKSPNQAEGVLDMRVRADERVVPASVFKFLSSMRLFSCMFMASPIHDCLQQSASRLRAPRPQPRSITSRQHADEQRCNVFDAGDDRRAACIRNRGG
ncbi:hypothetical protein VDGE_30071 [Verticillium dahliae]|uniref:Uncharacterized protein n=1 Tax=Verticillium dahliae TaxID=27337 RepID=A0A444RRF1_VERDA|nr:hypothetical protein VDGE_30071 [Verticillium dahliae]